MRRATAIAASILAGVCVVAACDGPSVTPPGVVDVPEGPCGHALYVVMTTDDYQSTSVGVVGFDGAVLASSILSGASATTGLSAPLSGDVVAPTTRTGAAEIVLVDRTPAGVVTWLDPTGAEPPRQLAVGPGTNPQDYVQVTPTKAYVPRFDVNLKAEDPRYRGGDVAIVRTDEPAITGSIDVATEIAKVAPGFVPHPARIVKAGGRAILLAPMYASGFKESGDSVLVVLDTTTDTVSRVVTLEGLRGCLALALSPDETRVAVGCSGTFGGGSTPSLDDAGAAVVDLATFTITPLASGTSLGRPPSLGITWSSNERVLLPVFGSLDLGTFDALYALGVGGEGRLVLDGAPAFSLGEVRCAEACGACFLTTESGVSRFPIGADGALGSPETIVVDGERPLVPRYLGAY